MVGSRRKLGYWECGHEGDIGTSSLFFLSLLSGCHEVKSLSPAYVVPSEMWPKAKELVNQGLKPVEED